MKKLALALLLVVSASLALTGCTTGQLAQYQQYRDQVSTIRAATTQEIAQQQQAIATQRQTATTLPADDPTRKSLDATIATEQKVVAAEQATVGRADQVLAQVDAAIKAANTGDTSGLTPLLSSIPVVGPYAGLAVFIGTTLYGLYRNQQLRGAVTQIVQSVERAFPTKTPEQQASLSAVQDTGTRKLVSQIKGNL